MSNRLESRSGVVRFRELKASFMVSTREITPDVSIIDYLKLRYIYLDFSQIRQVFGFVNISSPLYGGRGFNPYHSLTPQHCEELAANGIGLGLNLTNHFFDKSAYESSLALLDRYHNNNNAIMVTNDELARQLRLDFPRYNLKASVIKNISSLAEIEEALQLYDQLTLPMNLNDDDEFLSRIPCKEKIVLFANAACAYTCPQRSCYLGISQKNRGEKVTSSCSKVKMPRPDYGMVYFDVEKLVNLGFDKFKLIPPPAPDPRLFSWRSDRQKNQGYYKQPLAVVASYPKSGRTWLRYILAHYFTLLFGLNLEPDLQNFFSLLPNDTDDADKGLAGFAYYQQQVPLIPFSHKDNPDSIGHRKIVFVVRSPLAVMVSDYYQQREHLGVYCGGLAEFIRDPRRGIHRFCTYLNNWTNALQKSDHLVLSYEELMHDTQHSVTQLLGFLQLEIVPDYLTGAINQARFDKMQKLEQQQGLRATEYDRNNPKALRMRKGQINSYEHELTPDDQAWIKSILKEQLNVEAMALLIEHGCW